MMDDRTIADTVNTVRDIALNYHHTEQLRARLAHVLVPHLKRIAELERSATVLDAPAKVGNGTFGVGVKWSAVIGAAQRLYARDMTPENEAERIAKAKSATSFLEQAVEQADRIAKLEHVQGVLVGALEAALPIVENDKFLQEASYGKNFSQGKAERAREALSKITAALAAAQKPAGLRGMTEADFDAEQEIQYPDPPSYCQRLRDERKPYCPLCYTFGRTHTRGCPFFGFGVSRHITAPQKQKGEQQ